jgi:hypothetical protein
MRLCLFDSPVGRWYLRESFAEAACSEDGDSGDQGASAASGVIVL